MATGAIRSTATRRQSLTMVSLAASGMLVPLLAACGTATSTESPGPAATSAPAQPTAAAAKTDAPPNTSATPKAQAPPTSAESVTLVWDTFRGVGTPYPDEIIR